MNGCSRLKLSFKDLAVKPLSISSDAIAVDGDGFLTPMLSVPIVNIDNKFVNSVVTSCLSPIIESISVLLYKFDAVTFPVKYPVEEHTKGVYLLIPVYYLDPLVHCC